MTAPTGVPLLPNPFHPSLKNTKEKMRDMSWATLRNFWDLEGVAKAAHKHAVAGEANSSIMGGWPTEEVGTSVPVCTVAQGLAIGSWSQVTNNTFGIAIGVGSSATGAGLGAIATGVNGNNGTSGTGAIAIGSSSQGGAQALGVASIAIGGNRSPATAAAIAAGFHSVAIGPSSSVDVNSGSGIAIGDLASVVSNGIAIGGQANNSGLAIGNGPAQAFNGNSVAVGNLAVASGSTQGFPAVGQVNANLALGFAAQAVTNPGGIAIGAGAFCNGNNAATMGWLSGATHTRSTSLGAGSQTTTTDQIILGCTSAFFGVGSPPTRLYFFGANSAPTDSTIPTSGITAWIDETNNNLLFRVRYSNGTTLKTGTVALV
jgi:hypothetical protein